MKEFYLCLLGFLSIFLAAFVMNGKTNCDQLCAVSFEIKIECANSFQIYGSNLLVIIGVGLFVGAIRFFVVRFYKPEDNSIKLD